MAPKNLFLISAVESAYILYMFNMFKTRKNFAKGQCCSERECMQHQVGDTEEPESKICPFGKKMSWVAALYLMSRTIQFNPTVNLIVLGGGAIGSFVMNRNAFVYLVPVFITEVLLVQPRIL